MESFHHYDDGIGYIVDAYLHLKQAARLFLPHFEMAAADHTLYHQHQTQLI
ncbi:hypothetical protein CUZ89_1433 [Enterococcus xinjiangensis]|nr:hypothetical protein [Enterococcus lactis]MBL4991659.1 hypothetical protein [Enterococcus lactis]MBL4993600.1 hypothetical protein [Enterococcus lactis]MBL4996944.1 hypothetical protein [Enterococcus lactis]MBL4999179.1 hypothetical protein [Enterococcus lactis]